MQDVIPSSNPKAAAPQTGRQASHVVRLSWKLPARLRRPVGVKRPVAPPAPEPVANKAAPPSFERRPLSTKAVTGQHTSDVHLGARPKIKVSPPPYVGYGSKLPQRVPPAPRPPVKVPIARQVPVIPAERDVAYRWPEPKSPLALNVWIADQPAPAPSAPPRREKKKISHGWFLNLALLLTGCVVLGGLVWNLQGLGRLSAAWGTIADQARAAYQHLVSARSALAETDFNRSQQDFADAQQALAAAQADLDAALASSKVIISYLDFTGTVRSGTSMLAAGEALAQAGQAFVHALAILNEASPTDGGNLAQALARARQDLAKVADSLDQAERSLRQVGSPLLPADLKNTVDQLRQSVPAINRLVKDFLASSDVLMKMLGTDHARQYLVLFANNHELRPLGGFIGSIGLVDINQGRVENIDVTSVYDPDGQLKQFIAPPDPLQFVTDRWYLRDANWFVSYPVSARKIAAFFEKEGGPTVDGVIMITPDVIQDLLVITGPIELPAYDQTVTAENFREVTQREVTYDYDRQLNRPKQFLADLTPLLLNRLFSGQGFPQLKIVGSLQRALVQKDLLLYFRDEAAQERLRHAHLSGEFPADEPGFFSVNNANIGGHKSDQFISQEIDYRLAQTAAGDREVTVIIRRTHHGPQERQDLPYPPSEDPSQKDNIVYQRVFVPKRAELLEVHGFSSVAQVPRWVERPTDLKLEADKEIAAWQSGQVRHQSGTLIGSEAGYPFFANWQITKPGETSIGLYRYQLPPISTSRFYNPASALTVYIAKQPGAARTSLRVSLNLPDSQRIVHTIPTHGITQDSRHSFTYRGELTQDLLVGAAYVRE